MKKIFWMILIFFAIIPTFIKLVRTGFFPMQDDLQAFRVFEMNKCFSDFQIPCRWVPDAGYQYGYPQFNFYPPLPYYVGGLLHLVGLQYIDVVKILFIAGYLLSAITMFILIEDVTKSSWVAFITSLLYTYIPYKAVEVFVRGALSEFWAQIFFPLILWSIYKLIDTGKNKYLVWMSVSIFLLLTTHLLMTMIFVPVAIFWAFFWLYQKKWKYFGKVAIGGVIGFLLSAFFVLPVLFERQFIHTEGILSGYFDYRQHFVSLYKLFISREWGYGSSGFPNEKLNLSLGIIQWIFGLFVFPVLAIINFKKNKKFGLLTIMVLMLALWSIFMIHMKSSVIWAHIPFLWYLQFPWRFLAVSIFLLCLLIGLGLKNIGKLKYAIGVIIVAASIFLTINYYVPKSWSDITDKEKFSGTSWQKQLTISIFDYLPIYAKLPPIHQAPDTPEVLDGKASFNNYKKGSDFQTGEVKVASDATIRIPLFDFPGMKVKANGNVIKHTHNDCRGEEFCYGLITINLPKGSYIIEAKLTDTPVRKIGNYLSVAGIIIIIWTVFRKNEKFFK